MLANDSESKTSTSITLINQKPRRTEFTEVAATTTVLMVVIPTLQGLDILGFT